MSVHLSGKGGRMACCGRTMGSVRELEGRSSGLWTLDPENCTCPDYRPAAHDEPDAVNHPAHYTSDPSGVECITITRHRNFNVGNAMKYLWRAGLKDDARHVEDLEKALWYISDEIERLRAADQGTDRTNGAQS